MEAKGPSNSQLCCVASDKWMDSSLKERVASELKGLLGVVLFCFLLELESLCGAGEDSCVLCLW